MGLFFGLVMGIIYGTVPGIFAGLLFGSSLAAYMIVAGTAAKKKYLKYKSLNIKEEIIYEDHLFRLNGNAKDGRLYLTCDTFIAVIIKGKKLFAEIKILLSNIKSISQKDTRGVFSHVSIIQKDGTETGFIFGGYDKLAEKLLPLVGQEVFHSRSHAPSD